SFVAAFVCAPLLISLILCWTLIGAAALPFGAPAYVAIGLPLLLLFTGRIDLTFGRYAMLGLLGHFILCVPWAAVILAAPPHRSGGTELLGIYAVCGAIFAPLWSGTFAPLYRGYAKLNPNLTPIIERKAHA
ncbi:MAG: hypothetical protein AAF386_12785, partial [Pseudomonadota bacterium]